MAEKKAKEPEKVPDKPAEKATRPVDETPPGEKAEMSSKGLKGYIIPAAAAAGLFAIAMAASYFLQGNKMPSESPVIADSSAVAVDSSKSPAPTGLSTEELLVIDFDTTEIMKELAFLDFNPDAKPVDSVNPADTAVAVVDSLVEIQRERALLAEEKAVLEKSRTELSEKENMINAGLSKIEQAESARVLKLAKLYDGMKAAEVAKLMENLDDSTVVAIIPKMKAVNAAKVLALLPPKRAASISTQLITVVEK